MSTTPAPNKSIWRIDASLDQINALAEGNMVGHLGIAFTAIGADYLTATMPVDARTKQPFGLLHGGASVVLAETIASTASSLVVDLNAYRCVGLEINANHVKSAREGRVIGTARPVHLGRMTQVWEVRIEDETGRLICISRMTMAVVPV